MKSVESKNCMSEMEVVKRDRHGLISLLSFSSHPLFSHYHMEQTRRSHALVWGLN